MNYPISGEQVRSTFLDFFLDRGHKRIEGASLVPSNDPTLLYVNSGMAPLKPYFTGQQKPPQSDLCNVQPCLRTRDIEDVGDRHHLTFFEMLGSWSIGGYFKARAVELAYELLVDRYGLDPNRLYVTVFGGDEQLGLPPDEEAVQCWEAIGIPRGRVVALGMDDNFWGPAGDTGPCGPCTEIFYDFGPRYGEAYRPGDEFVTTGRYIEIWNAGVFMQFDKKRDGSFDSLPFFSVDTGSGLERLTMALNEAPTVYDTNLLAPLVTRCQELLDQGGPVADHHRLMADHLRAATFILAEGVNPSNEGRGYIPRRLIRKCVAVARREGVPQFDSAAVAELVIDLMGPHYPRLSQQRDTILSLLAEEEKDFSRAVSRGLSRLEELYRSTHQISGADAFSLFATYGLPFEITRDLATARGITVDEDGYREQFRLHQQTSRATGASISGRLPGTDPLPELPLPGDRQFVGYDNTRATGRVLALFVGGQQVERLIPVDDAEVLLDSTPFYAEGGGQVGDIGQLLTDDGTVFAVADTIKHSSGYHVHRGHLESGQLATGQTVTAQVDETARRATEANHSATHLLNAALREILGAHVRQAGSLVEPSRLRFDFNHPARLTAEQVKQIEQLVNQRTLAGIRRGVQVLPVDEAKNTGAVYLEGEDYGSSVRVISFDGAGTEFCGGTHVRNTSEVGLFKILSEQSIASGIRRLYAVTRSVAVEHVLENEQILADVAGKLKVKPAALPERIDQLLQAAKSKPKIPGAPGHVELVVDRDHAIPVATAIIDENTDARTVATAQAETLDAVVALAGPSKGRSRLVVAVPLSLAERVDARNVLKTLLEPLAGSGGGSPQLAQGGGERADDFKPIFATLAETIAELAQESGSKG